ncbi:hypothetical protein BV25DRAFT_383609 [Artomyces pyxidatus]|uniref:Uncharacterized protein n=1 Tax=Artomyces pyxidatus TaxID=48021 RepID=A0ACB8T4Z8_9AGAM|nr:hypothetical protein BV25DRAFT_383609 [Artomyces pyxidatus]
MPSTSSMISLLIAASAATAVAARPMYPEFEERANPSQRRQEDGQDSSETALQRLINSVKQQGVIPGSPINHVALARELAPLPDNFDFEGFFKNLQKGQPVPGILISRQENGEDSSETALQRFINSVKQQGVNVGDGRIQHVALARALEDRSFLDTFESFLAGLNPFAQQSTASTRDLELVASLARRALNELD